MYKILGMHVFFRYKYKLYFLQIMHENRSSVMVMNLQKELYWLINLTLYHQLIFHCIQVYSRSTVAFYTAGTKRTM